LRFPLLTEDRLAVIGEPDEAAGVGQTAIGTTVPHSARIWNYWLGGKDDYLRRATVEVDAFC
jgi:hypothetical protein